MPQGNAQRWYMGHVGGVGYVVGGRGVGGAGECHDRARLRVGVAGQG